MSADSEMSSREATSVPSARDYEGDSGRALAVRYESVDPDTLHADILHWLPRLPASVIDIGAGSGRDAAWLASSGYSVLAVEPSATMRKEGRQRHPNLGITWLKDSLPELSEVYRRGVSFDLAVLSAVWRQVPSEERERAFCKVANLLKPNGMIVMRVKTDPVETELDTQSDVVKDVSQIAEKNGGVVLTEGLSDDLLGRGGTKWSTLVFKFSNNTINALRPLRHVILKSRKTGTHKFGLIQSVLRAADSSQGFAKIDANKGIVRVPLGLVALNWLRLYKPLLENDLPQLPDEKNLGFDSPGWAVIENDDEFMFRPGARFCGEKAEAVHDILEKIAKTIEKNPSQKIVDPKTSDRIMRTKFEKPNGPLTDIVMDADYLSSFGDLTISVTLWRAMAKFGTQIEPLLVREWGKKIEALAANDHQVDLGVLVRAVRWHQPLKNACQAHKRVNYLMANQPVHCVWTGKRLGESAFDVDHCIPWAAWPCGDLWNLLPVHPSMKRDRRCCRLPASATLEKSAERILEWWDRAWHGSAETWGQFVIEAKASLPMLPPEPDLHSVFAGVQDRRFVIRADQGVEEWVQR